MTLSLFVADRVFAKGVLLPISLNMDSQSNIISPELLALTYGAFISQIVKDYEDVTEINKQIELLGYECRGGVSSRYNMGLRLIEDYLSKTHTRGIKSFQTTCENIATKALPMYTGVTASVESWNGDEQSCVLRCFVFLL